MYDKFLLRLSARTPNRKTTFIAANQLYISIINYVRLPVFCIGLANTFGSVSHIPLWSIWFLLAYQIQSEILLTHMWRQAKQQETWSLRPCILTNTGCTVYSQTQSANLLLWSPALQLHTVIMCCTFWCEFGCIG